MPKISKSKRRRVYRLYNMRCNYCKQQTYENVPDGHPRRATIDHKVPRWLKGSNSIVNLQLLCLECNGKKSRLESRIANKVYDGSTGERCEWKYKLIQHQWRTGAYEDVVRRSVGRT